MIQSEELSPGDELPPEQQFAANLGVSRATVREGLKLLEQDRLIGLRHGRRRVVMTTMRPVERPITELESVTEMMEALGYSVSNEVLGVSHRKPTVEEADALRLPSGDRVIELRRLRRQDGVALIVSIDVLPATALGDGLQIDWSGSLFELLRDRGYKVIGATAQIRAAHLPPALARKIGKDRGVPWLLLTQTHWTERGEPLLYSQDYHHGEKFAFHVRRHRARN
jgi:GntR family transcriptional regulator